MADKPLYRKIARYRPKVMKTGSAKATDAKIVKIAGPVKDGKLLLRR
jgi:hypothetical protein